MIEFDVDMGYLLEEGELDCVVLNDENGEHVPLEFVPQVGSGTCELIDRGKFTPHHDFHRVECSECGVLFWQSYGHLPAARFCPSCGKRVRKAVE